MSSSGIESIDKSISLMNEMLKNTTKVGIETAEKMMKMNVRAKIEGLGENIDIQA